MAQIVEAVRNEVVNSVVGLIDADASPAYIEFLTSGDSLLVTLDFLDPSFTNASGGSASLQGVPIDGSAVADGSMAKFSIKDGAGVVLITGSVATSGADINFNSVAVLTNDVVRLNNLTISQPAS